MENINQLVSVVITTYNREKSIRKAIESVLNQTHRNIELIIIDDGSIDETKEIIRPYFLDPRVRYFYEDNKGCADAMNNGIAVAKGKYVAILDSDDFWCDNQKIEKQLDFLEKNTDYVLVGGGATMIDEKGKEIVSYLLVEHDADIRKEILVNNVFAHVTVLFKKEAWEKVGGYDKNYWMEDWDLLLKMGLVGKLHNIQEIFANYLGHQRNNPSDFDENYSRLEQLKLKIKLKKKYRNYYPNYKKALLYCWIEYLFSLLPFKYELWPILFRVRKLFIRSPFK